MLALNHGIQYLLKLEGLPPFQASGPIFQNFCFQGILLLHKLLESWDDTRNCALN